MDLQDLPPRVEEFPVIPADLGAADRLYREARDRYVSGATEKSVLVVYIACMLRLGHNHELFFLSHKLSANNPADPLSWFCVGAYYWSCGKLEQAHKHLKKALQKGKDISMIWILLGHVLSAVEESEQALAAYRSAVRLLPNHWLPLLCIGTEFIRTNNLWLAAHTLQSARDIRPMDVSILNELGVTFTKLNKLNEALEYFQTAILQVQESVLDESSNVDLLISISSGNACEVSGLGQTLIC
jgi:anaphase-promoting complex subunit 6